jgi:hypothetical protein
MLEAMVFKKMITAPASEIFSICRMKFIICHCLCGLFIMTNDKFHPANGK